jgi:hypothetical protein
MEQNPKPILDFGFCFKVLKKNNEIYCLQIEY